MQSSWFFVNTVVSPTLFAYDLIVSEWVTEWVSAITSNDISSRLKMRCNHETAMKSDWIWENDERSQKETPSLCSMVCISKVAKHKEHDGTQFAKITPSVIQSDSFLFMVMKTTLPFPDTSFTRRTIQEKRISEEGGSWLQSDEGSKDKTKAKEEAKHEENMTTSSITRFDILDNDSLCDI